MQCYSFNADSNTQLKENEYTQFVFLKLKNKNDSIVITNADSVKKNNYFALKYRVIKQQLPINKVYTTTFFSKHALTQIEKQPKEISTNNTLDWVLLLYLFGFILFTWVVVFKRRRIKQIFNSLFTNRGLNQLIRDGNLTKEFTIVPLMSIYLITISIFTLFFLKRFDIYNKISITDFYLFVKIVFVFIILYFSKILFIKSFNNTFKNYNITFYYLLNGFTSDIIIGLLFLPLLFLYTFSNKIFSSNILFICIIILLVFNSIRLIRNILSSINYSRFSNLYLFLYLCTVEILPVILLLKLFNGLISFKLHL